MKKYSVVSGCLLVLFVMRDSHLAAAHTPQEMLKLPAVETAVLENGIRFFHIRDELPQVTIVISVGYGTLYEKKDTAGLSELIAKTISLGGSRSYPGSALHEKIDSLGGRLSVESSWENTVISVKVLDRFKRDAFAIAADLMTHPSMDTRSLDTAKALIADSIRRKYDDPAEIAFGKAREIIFGGDGYGSFPEEARVRSYAPDLIRGTWAKHCTGRNIMIGISASLDFAETGRLCREYFSGLAPGGPLSYEVDRNKILEQVAACRGKIFFYPKDIPQSTVVTGTVAPDIGYHGQYALEIMNYILGGGSFTSRLMGEIRVKRGLAYAVQSIVKFRHRTGVFLAYAQTENKTAGDVLSLLAGNIGIISRERVSPGEIDWARRAISNSFVFQFDTPMSVLANYMDIAYYGLPADYYTGYLVRISGVGEPDVLSEARKLFTPGLVTVVVGNESVLQDLKKTGDVVILK
ncbi:MAG: hypothetical protein A2176_06170 [Spirochaetes bacterium RBG_13_51_14]|nr:MAG: hypothetical protein A2176_06170 [Spirochaetes bacterium RBG_13_51_14]